MGNERDGDDELSGFLRPWGSVSSCPTVLSF